MVAHAQLEFDSLEDEVRFLRGLVSVQRLADEVLEDCLERQLGLSAAVDVFLTQCARMIHARGAFAQVLGNTGAVLTRVWGNEFFDVTTWAAYRGAVPLGDQRTVFVAGLTMGRTTLGSIGFLLPGTFGDGGKHVLALVEAVAEILDSAVLSFIALSEGQTPLERLESLSESGEFSPRARIGKYELLHPLGTGGMAQVMVARSWIEERGCSDSGDNCLEGSYSLEVYYPDPADAQATVRLTATWLDLVTVADSILSEDARLQLLFDGVADIYEATDAHLAGTD
jgi:serine/threonine-protein kinase